MPLQVNKANADDAGDDGEPCLKPGPCPCEAPCKWSPSSPLLREVTSCKAA
jgi:hypothetical protein